MTLKIKAIRGARWTTLSFIITSLLQFVQITILARILDPSSFGLMAIVTVVIGFAQIFSDMGISNAIIYRQDTTKNQLSSLYWLNIFAGVIMFIIILLLTPLIVNFYGQPQLTLLLVLTSLVFLITPIGQQFQILLQKELIFNNIAKVDIISSLFGTFTAIILAFLGFGVLSIVFGQITNTTIRCICLLQLCWKTWHPAIHFNLSEVKNYLNFGVYYIGQSTLNYFNSNLSNIIIGRINGVIALGLYSFAFNIILLPLQKINPILTQVAFPVFSKLQTDQNNLKLGYLSVLRILTIVNFPVYFGLLVTAPLFVPLIFGDKWLPSIVLLQILVGVGLVKSTGNPVGPLLYSRGLANVEFKWNALIMVTQIPGVILGSYYGGILGVAITLLILNILYETGAYFILVRRVLGDCLRDYLYSIWPAFWMSSVMGTIVWSISMILNGLPTFILLSIQIVTGIITYMLLMFIFYRKFVDELLTMVLPNKKALIKTYLWVK